MLGFFKILGDQELMSVKRQDPYYRSHPLSRERKDAVAAFIKGSPNSGKQVSADFAERHARMKAKLQAFIDPVSRTLRDFREDDPAIASRYARAIAYYRRPDLARATPLIEGLIAERPADPYFQELMGQMLFENGRADAALPYYEKSVSLAPGSPLLRRALGRVQMEIGGPELLQRAAANLQIAANADKTDPFSWRLLGTAYGKMGKMGESSLALGEEALLRGKQADARFHAERAAGMMEKGSVGWLQAQDILSTLDNQKPK